VPVPSRFFWLDSGLDNSVGLPNIMRFISIIICTVIFAGCTPSQAPVSLDPLKADLTRIRELLEKRDATMRWAIMDRSQLQMATAEWARKRNEEETAKENLTPEVKQQIDKYNQLSADLSRFGSEVTRRRMESMRTGPPGMPPFMGDPRSDPEYLKLSEAVAEARRPIAEIIDRRARRQYELQYPIKELIEEYSKDRFDLVVDRMSVDHSVLYRRTPEIPDITQGVIDLFRSKEK
jgi:hypothetical protein